MDILKLENTTNIRSKEKIQKNTEIKTSVHGLNSRIEMREKSVNLKMKQQKLSDLKDKTKYWKKKKNSHGPVK